MIVLLKSKFYFTEVIILISVIPRVIIYFLQWFIVVITVALKLFLSAHIGRKSLPVSLFAQPVTQMQK